MSEIIYDDSSFCFQYISPGYDNIIKNYCINHEIDNCIKLENNNKLVLLAKKLNINELGLIYGVKVILLYKGKNFNTNLVLKESNFNDKIIRKKYKELDINKDKTDEFYMKSKLILKLKDYNELGFMHETSLDNLSNIFKNDGIFCRNEVIRRKLLTADIAEYEVLRRTPDVFFKMARLYLRPKTPAHFKFNTYNKPTCILICDYNVIYNENNIYMTNEIVTKAKICNLNNLVELKWIYNNLNYNRVFEGKYVEGIAKDFKSAEFLIKDKLPLKYIKAIIFKTKVECECFINQFPNWEIDVICDNTLF